MSIDNKNRAQRPTIYAVTCCTVSVPSYEHMSQTYSFGIVLTATHRVWNQRRQRSHLSQRISFGRRRGNDKIKTQTLRSWFHLLQGFMQTHKNTVHYNTLGLQCNVLMSCCFRSFSLLTRQALAVVLGYKVCNCYTLSVTHFIRQALCSYAVTHFILNRVLFRSGKYTLTPPCWHYFSMTQALLREVLRLRLGAKKVSFYNR